MSAPLPMYRNSCNPKTLQWNRTSRAACAGSASICPEQGRTWFKTQASSTAGLWPLPTRGLMACAALPSRTMEGPCSDEQITLWPVSLRGLPTSCCAACRQQGPRAKGNQRRHKCRTSVLASQGSDPKYTQA